MKNLKYSLPLLIIIVTSTASISQELRGGNAGGQNLNADQNIKVIELRDYVIRRGRRDEFIRLFDENFTQSQNILGGHVLGQYRVKGADDNFFWIRGFKDMPARNKFLNAFYYGSPAWKQHKGAANSMLLNNDNVHLLKPLNLKDGADDAEFSFNTDWFGQEKGVAVVDFYTSNTKLEKLVVFVKKKYVTILNASKIENTSFWISETTPNEFTVLPAFQDRNLLVQITFFKNESEYQAKTKDVNSRMNDELMSEMADLVTIKNTLVLYPTGKSFLPPNTGNSLSDSATQTTDSEMTKVRRAIDAGNAVWVEAWAKGDATMLPDTFTTDGKELVAGGKVFKGRKQILALMRDAMRMRGGKAKLTVTTTDVWLDFNTAYETGTAVYEFTVEGQRQRLERRYFTIWKRQTRRGPWKIYANTGVAKQ